MKELSAPLRPDQTASGFDPRQAAYETVHRIWESEGETLDFTSICPSEYAVLTPEWQDMLAKLPSPADHWSIASKV